jgi:hypothetical protein
MVEAQVTHVLLDRDRGPLCWPLRLGFRAAATIATGQRYRSTPRSRIRQELMEVLGHRTRSAGEVVG